MTLRVSIRLLFRWSTLPKTCTSTRWWRCGGVCIVAFGTTTFDVSDSRFFCCCFFFTITNTKDPVEKTFCFTGNKKIIYASVKCNLLPLFIHPNQASLEFTETNRKHTGDFCIFIHPCGEWNERTVPTDRTQLLCTTFQVLMNKRWNWQSCLSLLFCPPNSFILLLLQTTLTTPSALWADVVAVLVCLLLWYFLVCSFQFYPFFEEKSH